MLHEFNPNSPVIEEEGLNGISVVIILAVVLAIVGVALFFIG